MAKVTQAEFGRAIGLQRPRVSDLVRSGAVDLSQGLDASIAAYCQDLRDKLSNRRPEPGSLTDHRTRLEKVKADLAERELAIMDGELVRADDVRDEWIDILTTVRGKLLAIPGRLERVIVKSMTKKERGQAFKKEVYAVLNELSDDIKED